MSKIIDIIRKATPEADGFNDHFAVLDNGVELLSGRISTEPNPFRPKDKSPWYDVYARIAEGTYKYQCIPDHHKFGRCLLINDGGDVTTLNPNSNRDGGYVGSQIFIHTGWSETWRGSKGCLTIPPSNAIPFFICFDDNEVGKLTIRKVEAV